MADGGFMPFGLLGVWLGSCYTFYSFIGVESVAVSSGEAADPGRTIPRAMLRMIVGLTLIYMLMIVLLVGIMPWRQAGVGESPFVMLLRQTGIPGAASIMNFVVLTAALSSANANLYLITRSMFSLARGGFVPAALGAVNAKGTPVNALLFSSVGLALAVVIRAVWPNSAYVWFFGVSLFGALLVFIMVFVTHLMFRRYIDRTNPSSLPLRIPGSQVSSVAGLIVMVSMLITTWWVPGLEVCLKAAGPWMVLLGIGYWVSQRSRAPEPSAALAESSR